MKRMKQIRIRFSACKSRTVKNVVKEQPSFCASRRALGGTDDFYFQLGQMRFAAVMDALDANRRLKRVACQDRHRHGQRAAARQLSPFSASK